MKQVMNILGRTMVLSLTPGFFYAECTHHEIQKIKDGKEKGMHVFPIFRIFLWVKKKHASYIKAKTYCWCTCKLGSPIKLLVVMVVVVLEKVNIGSCVGFTWPSFW